MSEKKLVFPGDHVSSAEEAEAGESTYEEKDEIFSSTVGEIVSTSGTAAVKSKAVVARYPKEGSDVYCIIVRSSPNNALAECIPAEGADNEHYRGLEMDGVLSVRSIRGGFVRDLRDEVKIGDIIKARVERIENGRAELTIAPPGYGVIRAFCPKCRSAMALKDQVFICSCGWTERRKTTQSASGVRSGGRERRPGQRRFGDRRSQHVGSRFDKRKKHD